MKNSDIKFLMCIALYSISVISTNYFINEVCNSVMSIEQKMDKHKKVKHEHPHLLESK